MLPRRISRLVRSPHPCRRPGNGALGKEIEEQPLREVKNIVEARSKENRRRKQGVREVVSIKEGINVDSERDDDDNDYDFDVSDLPLEALLLFSRSSDRISRSSLANSTEV